MHVIGRWRWLALVVALTIVIPGAALAGQVVFDLPDTIECREVTPPEFHVLHPSLKVIEAKLRISARLVEGELADVVDYMYVLTSADKTLRLQDYLPNTTLESAMVDDQVEFTDNSEKAKTTGVTAHVAYKMFEVGGSHNLATKKSESTRYKQIVPKELVLASGTTHRGHGVFFRLRPSRAASLEGAKEFTFLATVPTSWRADLCTIVCSARAKKSSLISTSVVPAGGAKALVAMYLAGDVEAITLAEEHRRLQDTCVAALAEQAAKEGFFNTVSTQAVGLFKKSPSQTQKEVDDARRAVLDAQTKLREMAK